MELVYLWVEDYKNIHKQGFNFSPRFSCEYDDVKNELTIKENDDYIENFFGENINIMAIVGKNGSGKSSILEVLSFILENKYSQKIIMVYNYNDFIYYISNKKIKTSLKVMDIIKNIQYLQYTSDMTYELYDQIPFDNINEGYNSPNKVSLDSYRIGEMISNQYLQEKKIELTTFMYLPTQIEIILIDLTKVLHSTFPFVYESIFSTYDSKYTQTDEELYKEVEYVAERNKERELEKKEIDDLKRIIEKVFNNIEDNFHKVLLIEYLKLGQEININILDDIDELMSIVFYGKSINEDDFIQCFKRKKADIVNLSEDTKNIYFSEYKEYFKFDYVDSKKRRFSDLSHGERMIFTQFINIYFNVVNSKEEKFIFLFDEPELSFHPNWQKKYLLELNNLLLKLNNNCHFIFSSHSPFLLSDIPKQNIIFLDKDEKGNCKVVDGLNEKKQTFGANIHTLLSDSFFMEDGLIGEFAKSKINEIIDFHKLVKKNKYKNCLTKIYLHSKQKKFWQTQKIIGEEYLKQVIKNHLLEIEKKLLGKDRAKQEEIKRVEAYLESLKK